MPLVELNVVVDNCTSSGFCDVNNFGSYSLAGSCGLLDPCEKEKTDAAGDMTDQEREDLTAGAQVLHFICDLFFGIRL